eukprot:TRINITY_DN1949_c0_g1_i5.p1 TRINITY_DN1949_c0_g1~~TRINITY_DN1949_c0_g1_i5.p1  ORF type:complete len:382 (-),score=86.58 TRINITY_DN1949_c0_g1_i5:12-1157(-)
MGGSLGHIGHIIGVISQDKLEGMRIKLHNAMRGNAILKHQEIEEDIVDPLTGMSEKKVCFVVYFHGNALTDKILRFAKAFGATIYPPVDSFGARSIKIQELSHDIVDRLAAIRETTRQKFILLSDFYEHAVALRKFTTEEKLIFYTLNKCSDQSEDGTSLANRTITRLRACVWTPTFAVPTVRAACRVANRKCADAGAADGDLVLIKENNLSGKDDVKPTYNPVNRFTTGFQAIIDGYGIPDYQEINPTVFATAMFPFLFGVMFGDWIHGSLMTIFAALLIWKEDYFLAMEERNEIFEYMFSGRYTIFMMGICGTYMGLIYNEALSCSIDFFGTAYQLSLIHISEPTRLLSISYAVFCLKKKKKKNTKQYSNNIKYINAQE